MEKDDQLDFNTLNSNLISDWNYVVHEICIVAIQNKERENMIREIMHGDLEGLMVLYMQLHSNPIPEETENLSRLWDTIISDQNHYIIVAEENGKIVSSCVCVIIPNLTHNQQPYALIENVITDGLHRNKGLATQCLEYAKEIAIREKCYKMMLLTGSKKKTTLNFYRKAGYNNNDKTAFVQWL